MATWDIDRGLSLQGRDSDSGTAVNASDPLSAIRSLGTMANPDGTALLVLRNFNRFLNNIEVVQALDSAIAAGKTGRTFVVVLSAVVTIPVELEAPVRGHRARPARPRPARADRPRDCHRAGRAAGRRGADGRARRGGRPDPGRGRECVEPVAGPARPGHARRALGAQGPDVKEKRPADPAPGRRELRRSRAGWRPSSRSAPAPCGRGGGPMPGPAACSCSGRRGRGNRRAPRPWAGRPAGPP